METSSTANSAKLAVLWRDRKKEQEAAAGVPDRFVRETMDGALINPEEGQPLVNSATVFTRPPPPGAPQFADDLKSLYALVAELRAVLVSQSRRQLRPTESLVPIFAPNESESPFEVDAFHGGSVESAVRDLLALSTNNTTYPVGFEHIKAMREAAANPGTGLTSVFDIAVDLKKMLLGTGPKPTERTAEYLQTELADGELPFFQISLIQWAKHIESRLGDLESRLDSLESRS